MADLAKLLSGSVSLNRAALQPLDVQALLAQKELEAQQNTGLNALPVPDPLAASFSENVAQGASAHAQDYGASQATGDTLGELFAAAAEMNPAAAFGGALVDSASNPDESIWNATQTGLDLVNPGSKIVKTAKKVTDLLGEPEIKPVTPTATTLAQAVEPPPMPPRLPEGPPIVQTPSAAPTPAPGPPLASSVRQPGSNRPSVDGTWGVMDRPDLMFEGVPPSEWTPGQFGRYGESMGASNIGPLDEDAWYASLQPFTSADGSKTFYIPGGLDDATPFTYFDDLFMKSQAINPAELDEATRTALHNRTVAAKSEPPEGWRDEQIFNQFLLGMTSPNNPLTPNEFAVAAAHVKGPEDLKRFAEASGMDYDKSSNYLGTQGAPAPGTEGTPYSPDDRKRASLEVIDKVGAGAGARGGLGVGGSADWTRISDLAQMMRQKPEFFRFRGADEGGRNHEENWANFVDRIITQVPGLKAKTGSFSAVWQDPAGAGISALDRHMLAIIRDNMFETPAQAKKWNDDTLKKWNNSVKAYNKDKNNKVKRKPVKNIDALSTTPGGTDFFNEEAFKVINNPKETLIRNQKFQGPAPEGQNTGRVNDTIAPHLRPEVADYVKEPLKTVQVSDSYKRGLQDVTKKGARPGSTGLFSDQWYLWDPQRQRFEPHEIMQPGLVDLDRMSHAQHQEALGAHADAGYLNYSKDETGKLQPVQPVPFKEGPDVQLSPERAKMKEKLRGLNPSRLAAFAATGVGAAGLVQEELERRRQESGSNAPAGPVLGRQEG